MSTLNTKASNSVENVAIVVTVLSWISIFIGIIVLILTLSWDESVAPGFVIIAGGILGFISKAIILGFHKIVLASELYIHLNKPKEE